MWCCLISLFPDAVANLLATGVVGQALRGQRVRLLLLNPRDFTVDAHRKIDDRPYGGGPGMVMMPEPLFRAIQTAKSLAPSANPTHVVYLSPQGKPWHHRMALDWAQNKASSHNLILIAGRYEGIDERILTHCVDEEWSIGDYVSSGGDLPALVILDSIIRLLPGVLGDAASSEEDSFSETIGGLLDCPHYTRPRLFRGEEVPEVLLSGHHEAIQAWRQACRQKRTRTKRPDLLQEHNTGECQP